ncbi:MAG TPA: hypothetical protein VJ438_04725 [Candidatus Nanoarchaeia archaeon]|nr:hypothetical protein [Candidatus Nanoarchaeia archaeon]
MPTIHSRITELDIRNNIHLWNLKEILEQELDLIVGRNAQAKTPWETQISLRRKVPAYAHSYTPQ